MSASISPTTGYSGHYGSYPIGVGYKLLEDGTVAPYGALSFLPFTPKASIAALKYMYTMSASDVQNFLTTDFMSVTNTANSNAVRPINVVMVTSGGSGYPNGTFYTKVRGDGTTQAIVRLQVTGGAIQEFGNGSSFTNMQNAGVGYSFATVDLSTANIFSDASASTAISGATATSWTNATAVSISPIIDPTGGHGANDIEELGGHFVMVQGKFEPADADATQVNDFRRVGIVKNPTVGGSVASIATARTTNALRIAGTISTNYQVDELITQATTGAVGKVVEWDATNKILYYIQTRHNDAGADTNGNVTAFSGTNVITGQTSSATGTPQNTTSTVNNVSFTAGYAAPELKHDTGEILYVENRTKIARATDQTENIKLIIESVSYTHLTLPTSDLV